MPTGVQGTPAEAWPRICVLGHESELPEHVEDQAMLTKAVTTWPAGWRPARVRRSAIVGAAAETLHVYIYIYYRHPGPLGGWKKHAHVLLSSILISWRCHWGGGRLGRIGDDRWHQEGRRPKQWRTYEENGKKMWRKWCYIYGTDGTWVYLRFYEFLWSMIDMLDL